SCKPHSPHPTGAETRAAAAQMKVVPHLHARPPPVAARSHPHHRAALLPHFALTHPASAAQTACATPPRSQSSPAPAPSPASPAASVHPTGRSCPSLPPLPPAAPPTRSRLTLLPPLCAAPRKLVLLCWCALQAQATRADLVCHSA